MSKENTSLSIVQQLDSQVVSVIGSNAIQGFQKAFLVAEATGKLTELLTAEYMKPIMNLQGNKLGFKSDKDKTGGYDTAVVKNCLIEAVLSGVQPVGNQFNIIASNMYITKEGFGYLLSRVPGLWYQIIPELPRVNNANTSAAIVMKVSWSISGSPVQNEQIEIPIKVNSMMGTDAIIGKATRKARYWLYNTITGCELPEGDVSELDSKTYIVQQAAPSNQDVEDNRVIDFINDCKTTTELQELKDSLDTTIVERLELHFINRENELIVQE